MTDCHSALSADTERYLRFWSLQFIMHLARLVRQPGGELAVLKVLGTTGQREDNDLDEPDLAEHPENEPRPNQQEELGGIDHSVPVASAATS